MIALPEFWRKPRTWLVLSVVIIGALAWIAVAIAASTYLEYSGYLGVVAIGLTVGSIEVAYLAGRCWDEGFRREAMTASASASLGSLLIFGAMFGGVARPGFVAVASGVGLVGIASAVGVWGLFKALGRSTPATVTGMVIVAVLAYFSSLMWAAVPA